MNRLSFAALALIACSTDTFVAPDSGGGDAGSDAPATGDGGCPPVSPCPTGDLCVNFDQSSYSPFLDISKNGGQVDFSSDEFVSCPKSLVAKLPQATAVAVLPQAEIAQTIITGNVNTANGHLEADVFLPESTPGPASYLALAVGTDPNSAVALAVGGGGGWMLSVLASNNTKLIAPRVGAWNHFTLDVVFSSSGGTGHAKLSFTDHNGQPATVDIFASTVPGSTSTIGNVIGAVGIQAANTSTGSVTAYYDNVAFGTPP